jgi:rubrerythrin
VKTSAELLSVARAMEERSAERYRELADSFEMSCNPDTAEAFVELADIESGHAAEFPATAGARPETVPWGEDDPEIADPDAVHYLMWPWHAFDLGLRHEQETLALFEALADKSPFPDVRAEAARLVEREKDHVRIMQARRDREPLPPEDWDEDEDGPNWEAGD